MTQQDLSEFKCSDSEGEDADKSVKYVSIEGVYRIEVLRQCIVLKY